VGAAGLAILLRLPDEEAQALIEAAAPRLARYNRMDTDTMRMLLAQGRERGYAVCGNWVTLGVTAVAMPLCTADGRPLGSLSISAVNHRMPAERWPQLAALLRQEAEHIQRRLNMSAPAPGARPR
jgi:DNA-binding IclR family transcriptional regulator